MIHMYVNVLIAYRERVHYLPCNQVLSFFRHIFLLPSFHLYAYIGLFDPHNPPQKIEPNTQVKIRMEPMGLWAGHWQIQSDLCTIYNITLMSAISTVGVFLRSDTMPTIVHYNHFDRIIARQLKTDAVVKKDSKEGLPKETFPSVSSETHLKPVSDYHKQLSSNYIT